MKNLLFFFILTSLIYQVKAQVKESYKAQVAYKIVETSPRCKQLTKGLYERIVKNGGTSYGIMLESSPNPKTDPSQEYSKTYNFNLHESYSDRMPVIARFVFDPKKQQLYEDDVVNAQLVAIPFDKKLLLLFNQK
ncbi:hypothetical protein [Pedobacter alluvionis]|uniref:Uncharacterized protein n=1 Tax=Pedobacter alluvionis TaxID=475253 RepID=A0A497XUR5_9SPHI|nr:hypothetical protein [Pedobacter alluvionis]RLJ72130.1 hypothetical protein BCL90_4972 [Pedobacter alluvionis]TFB28899.1 hypothetical protein E3V97_22545 [Pedobacter alluvionis]